MARKTATRGRPKGTGVDDGARLIAMADLIAANPGMKPTTAIKSLGITNPSVIRRLRDKYNLDGSPVQKPAPVAPQRQTVAPLRASSDSVLKQAPARRAPRASAPPRTIGNMAKPEPAADPLPMAEPNLAPDQAPIQATSQARPDLMSAFFAAGVSAAHVVFQMQLKTWSLAFEGSPLACMARGQEFMRLVSAAYLATPAETRCSRP